MKVSELIEYLKTLEQDYIVEIGDSELPDTELTKYAFEKDTENKSYRIY